MSVCSLVIAPLEAFGVGDRLWRTTPRARSAVAGVGILLAAGGAASGLYIFTDSVAAWWLAPLASFPVIYLFFLKNGRPHDGGQREGPYTPPDAGA
jgi:hypothetical protein